jgi:hypothetical protein
VSRVDDRFEASLLDRLHHVVERGTGIEIDAEDEVGDLGGRLASAASGLALQEARTVLGTFGVGHQHVGEQAERRVDLLPLALLLITATAAHQGDLHGRRRRHHVQFLREIPRQIDLVSVGDLAQRREVHVALVAGHRIAIDHEDHAVVERDGWQRLDHRRRIAGDVEADRLAGRGYQIDPRVRHGRGCLSNCAEIVVGEGGAIRVGDGDIAIGPTKQVGQEASIAVHQDLRTEKCSDWMLPPVFLSWTRLRRRPRLGRGSVGHRTHGEQSARADRTIISEDRDEEAALVVEAVAVRVDEDRLELVFVLEQEFGHRVLGTTLQRPLLQRFAEPRLAGHGDDVAALDRDLLAICRCGMSCRRFGCRPRVHCDKRSWSRPAPLCGSRLLC